MNRNDRFEPSLLKYIELVVLMSKQYQRDQLGEGMVNYSDQDTQQKMIMPLTINLI